MGVKIIVEIKSILYFNLLQSDLISRLLIIHARYITINSHIMHIHEHLSE